MASKIKIDYEQEFKFNLIGIVTPEPVYRIAFLINELLQISLSQGVETHIYNPKKQIVQEFITYSYNDNMAMQVILIQNRGNIGFFIDEHSKLDYFIKITNSNFDITNFIVGLKQTNNINMVLNIEPAMLKSRHNLLFIDNT